MGKKKVKCIIVSGAPDDDYDFLKTRLNCDAYVIAADSGYIKCMKAGVKPDLIIGDFDSSKYPEFEAEIIKLQPEKDFTDMELSLLYALDLYSDFTFDEIFIFGGTGTRFDHSLTNAHILRKALDRGVLAWLIDENNKICLVDKHIKLSGNKNDLISLIPFTTEVFGVTTKGLYYGLSDAHMKIGASIGISNVMICDECEIFVQEGILFVILARD